METIKHYSDEFKKSVVQEVLDGLLSKEEARQRYGIKGNSAVLNWIRKFDQSKDRNMKSKEDAQSDRKTLELEAENRRLREELAMEQLRVRALNVMIDLAETDLNVSIRKKSGTKQSKN
ncbi:MAG: transposase [Bacteroidales bacterium]|nr:transposase [Bacteroidales bacterium]